MKLKFEKLLVTHHKRPMKQTREEQVAWKVVRTKTRKTHLLSIVTLIEFSRNKNIFSLTSLPQIGKSFSHNMFTSSPSSFCQTISVRCSGKVCWLVVWVKSAVFLFRFDSLVFFLLTTKIHCLNGINISEIAPNPSPIIYILEQENSKLLKTLFYFSTVLIYKGTYYWGGKKLKLLLLFLVGTQGE